MKLPEIEERMKAINAMDENSLELDELKSINEEYVNLTEQRKAILEEAEKRRAKMDEVANMPNAEIVKEFKEVPEKKEERKMTKVDKLNTVEYREAFMDYCKTGKMAVEYRLDAFTDVAEAAAMVPTTIMGEVVRKMVEYGEIFARVRQLNVKGGVNIPILSLKPTASWITEATPSDRLKVTANTSVSFSYFGLEVKVATSLLADAATLAAFESLLTSLVAEAMVIALEKAIIIGVGATEPVGIAVDPRVPAGQIITLSSAEFLDYGAWKKKVVGKIPKAYRRNGSWLMAVQTFEGYIDGMVDANGQPVGKVNLNITDGPQERFNGKEVLLVEDDVIEPYDTAANGEVVAIYCNLKDYAVNSNMQMQVFRWLDHDTNQYVDKAILVADGKLVDPNGVVIVKKGA